MDIHVLYAVNIDTVGAGDVFIDQITDFNVDTAINEILEGADGMVDPTFVAVQSQSPKVGFTSTKLATALAKCGISGLAISADADEDGAEFWFQKVAEGGTRTSGSNHLKMTMKKGLLVPRSLSAPNDGIANLTFEALAVYDLTNDPIVIATSQSLEGTPVVDELFTCGPVEINGVALAGIQEITIDFGITELIEGADGQVWPTFVGIMTRRPVITIRTLDVLSLNTFGLSGKAQGATDSKIYLRKIAEGGTRVADATEEHISFAIDEGRIMVNTISGGHDAPQMSEVKITPSYDGSNDIMVINTATAIT